MSTIPNEGGGGHIIQEEGSSLTARAKLNFIGTNVEATDNATTGATDVTVTGGAGTDEKVKYDAGDPTAGYVADKVVAGTGISVAEGSGATENKLVVTNAAPDQTVAISGGTNVTIGGTYPNLSITDNSASTTTVAGKENFHGVQSVGTLAFDNTEHILSVASIAYWYKGASYTSATPVTCDLDLTADRDNSTNTLATNKLYFFYFKDATGKLYWSDTPWNFKENVFVATVYWNGSAGACQRETHSHTRDIDWHIWAHDTIGTRYESGFSLTAPTTAADETLNIGTGTIHDEDLDFATGAMTTMRAWYQVSSGVYTFSDYSLPFTGTSGAPTFLDTDTYSLSTFANGDYCNYWVYATLDINRPLYIVPSQRSAAFTTLNNARAELAPSLSGAGINPEWKLIYRFIYSGNGQFLESADYRTTSTVGAGATASTTAGAVSFSPSGGISSTTVQTAIEELDTEKVPYTGASGAVTLGANTLSTTSGLISPKLYPASDSTTAVQINKADGTTNVLNVDTTNARVGIGTTAPATFLDIGTAGTSLGTIRVSGNTSGNVTIQPQAAAGTDVVLTLPNASGTLAKSASSPIVLNATTGNITHATTAGNKHIVTGGSTGQLLINSGASGTSAWGTVTESSGALSNVTSITTSGDIELGHATDTTLHRVSAGVVSIEGANILVSGGALGTPSSGTATNLSGTATSLNIGGNAATATKLAATKTINGVAFDGSGNITVPSDITPSTSGNVLTSNGSLWTSAAPVAGNPTLADESADETCFLVFATGATGAQALKTQAALLTYNSHSGNIGLGDLSDDTGHTVPQGWAWYPPAATSYGVYKTIGAWSAPDYQQLSVSFATGVIIDGGTAYGKSGTNIQPAGGNVKIGTTVNAGTSGNKVLVMASGTAPSTSPADVIQLYAEDVVGTEATGGTITRVGGKTIHTFTTTGSGDPFIVPTGGLVVDYLVVAGGGAGGARSDGGGPGGGGAGGFKTGTGKTLTAGTKTVTVGDGGTGTATTGNSGGNSVFDDITSTGGGGGALIQTNGVAGGSGGGGGGGSGTHTGGAASPAGQGNAGGSGTTIQASGEGGGGGGAGAVGATPNVSGVGGNGGDGLSSTIRGTGTVYYSGGGGGTGYATGAGSGGNGGGGAGSTGTNIGTAGTANTGGGGGATRLGAAGGAGGSGIVIISYTTPSTVSELRVRDELGNVTTLSPHNTQNMPTEVIEENKALSDGMAWTYHSERDGKSITVDMFRAVQILEKLSGEKLIYHSENVLLINKHETFSEKFIKATEKPTKEEIKDVVS